MFLEDLLSPVLKKEGGYVNHPKDRGGPTNYGITQKVYNNYRKGLPTKDVKDITMEEVESIYYKNYYLKSRANLLEAGLDLFHFDCAVNHGPKQAIILLQRAVGADEDGVIGKQTLGKVASFTGGIDNLIRSYSQVREAFFNAIVKNDPSQKVFLKGWLNRNKKVAEESITRANRYKPKTINV